MTRGTMTAIHTVRANIVLNRVTRFLFLQWSCRAGTGHSPQRFRLFDSAPSLRNLAPRGGGRTDFDGSEHRANDTQGFQTPCPPCEFALEPRFRGLYIVLRSIVPATL